MKCIDCGAEISRSAKRCRSCSKKGKNNPSYKTGANVPGDLGGDMVTKKLEIKVNELQRENKKLQDQVMMSKDVSEFIVGIKEATLDIPDWMVNLESDPKGIPGVPVLQLSDIHYGETVYPEQVFSKNEYNINIANSRLSNIANNASDLLVNHMGKGTYPGLVVAVNGDLATGNIHEELTSTNDKPIMPVILELYENLICFFENLADVFGRLFIPWTVGNHGRTTQRPQSKNKVYTNYDWLIGKLIEKYFEDDNRVGIVVSDGSDIQYKIYSHKYCQTHGDQFRGGAGFLGSIAPITRGEMKKNSSAMSYGEDYDTLIIGHFHQLMFLNRVIVNGSVIGFSEYALHGNFPCEVPQQALWLTHPIHGITLRAPVFCGEIKNSADNGPWVSWRI